MKHYTYILLSLHNIYLQDLSALPDSHQIWQIASRIQARKWVVLRHFNLLPSTPLQQPMNRIGWYFSITYFNTSAQYNYKTNQKLIGRCRDIQYFCKRPLISLPLYKGKYKENFVPWYLHFYRTDFESDWRLLISMSPNINKNTFK